MLSSMNPNGTDSEGNSIELVQQNAMKGLHKDIEVNQEYINSFESAFSSNVIEMHNFSAE